MPKEDANVIGAELVSDRYKGGKAPRGTTNKTVIGGENYGFRFLLKSCSQNSTTKPISLTLATLPLDFESQLGFYCF